MSKILAMSFTSVVDVQDGNSVVDSIIEYATSASGTVVPGTPLKDGDGNIITDINGVVLTQGNWSTELPTIAEGEWLWTRTRTIYSDGQFTIVYNVSRSGMDGTQGDPGATISREREQWYVSTSSTSVTGGSWSYEEPDEIPENKYLWGRVELTMSDGSVVYSDAVHRSTISGLINLADEVNKKITQKIWQDDISSSINAYDGSIGANIRNRVSQTEQDITGITSTVSDISSELSTKADGEEFKTLQNTVTQNKQTADSFQQTVTYTYAKLSDVDTLIGNIKIGGNNLYVIADEVPGYIHASSGAIMAPQAIQKERTSQFIPVKEGESYVIQSWATPTTDDGESWLAYQYYSNSTGTPVGKRVNKYGKTSGSGVETTADGQEHLTYKITIPEGVKYLRVSYRHFDDGYAMVEKATTASEYAINPRDLEKYADDVVNTAKTEIKQTTDSISLSVASKVGADEIISKINLSKEDATIQASKVDLIGNVTFNMLDTTTRSRIDTIESTANSANASATLANDKANPGLAMKINYSAFSTFNNGECYIHGFNEDNEPADVDGYIYYKGRKITVAKKMINPNTICPYYKTIYLVLRLSSATATYGDLYMVWYDSGWKYGETPTPTVANTWSWVENKDIVIGQFVEPHSEGAIVDARLYNPPKSPYEVVTTLDNPYGYAYGVVNWVGNNGTSLTNALSMIKKWTDGAVSDTTTIQGGWIATNTITSNQLATDAIMSNNYKASSNLSSPYSLDGTFLDLTNGNFWTPNFGVIQVAPQGTTVQPGAWFNGTVYGTAGRFGEGSSYWSIEQVEDYNIGTHAALVGTGNPYLQTGNWQINDNAIQTRKYTSTAEYSGESTYYKDASTNTYYDVGMKIPTDFSARSSTDSAVTTYNKSFFYGRKYTGNDIPTMDSEWTYFFQVDNEGNIYEQGQPLNKRYAAIGDVEGQYISTIGGTVNGNLTVTGTLVATADAAKKVVNALSINGQSFDGSDTVTVGTIGVAYGGTGKTSWTANRIVYASATNTLNQLVAGNSGQLLRSNGSAAPTWIDQSSIVAGNATNATNATNDANGDKIDTTYRKLSDTAFPNGLTGNVTGNVSGTAGSVKNNLIIKLNGGTTEGTNLFTYNGSNEKTINITKSSIGLGNVQNTKLSTWAGSVNLTTTSVGTLAEAAAKGVDDAITGGSTSDNLPTSAAVADFVESQNYGVLAIAESTSNGKISVTTASGTSDVAIHGLGSWAYRSSGSASDVGLGNVTNNKQVKGLSSGTTSGHLVSWGSDGYTVADSGVTTAGVKKTVTTLASNDDGKIVLTYLDGTTSDPIEVKIIGQSGSSVSYADALNVNGVAVGSASKPVFFNAQGKPQQANTIPTITLNGSSTTSASFYAPADAGNNNQYLKSNGSGVPTWATFSKSTVGLGNVDNTSDANKNVLSATKFTSAQSVTLTGDTTGTASSQAGWSLVTTTKKITNSGRLASANVDNSNATYLNKITYFLATSSMTEGKPPTDAGILNFAWDNNKWSSQLAIMMNSTPHIYIRGNNNTSWDANWLTVLDSNNYNNYAPTKTGIGASGTWGISITGNAATATSATSATKATNADYLANHVVDETTINNTVGTFSFTGSGTPWAGLDWVGLQVGSSNDKWQLIANNGDLQWRQNDSGSSDTANWNAWKILLNSSNYSNYAVPKSGGEFTGAVTGTSFSATDYIRVNASSGTSGGLALWNTDVTQYGIAMRLTENGGTHGYVTGDYAIYSYMKGSAARGWIFKNYTHDNGVASISNGGNAVFNGSVTVGGNATNTSGMRIEYDENLQCTNFIFN